jgi:hypothetical protein
MVCDVTMAAHKQSITPVEQSSPHNLNLNNFKIVEAMGLKITALRSP